MTTLFLFLVDSLLNQITDDELQIPQFYVPKISEEILMSQLNILKYLNFCKNISNDQTSCTRPVASTSDQLRKTDSTSLKRGFHNYMDYVRKRCKGDILLKLQYSEPYRFFLSSISAESKTHDEMLTVSFSGLY